MTTQKRAFYTALFVLGDNPSDLIGRFTKIPNWDYILFTNKEPSFFGECDWEIRQVIPYNEKYPTISNKHVKWMTHLYLPEYEYTIYIDAYMSPNENGDFDEILNKLDQETIIPFYTFEHPVRDCIYDACGAVVRCKKDVPINVNKVLELLIEEKMPRQYGLYELCMMAKKPMNEVVKTLSSHVFYQVINYSHRDQLGFTYILWKMGLPKLTCLDRSLFKRTGSIISHQYVDNPVIVNSGIPVKNIIDRIKQNE